MFGWLFGDDDKEDRSIIEISNDRGDHWVAEIPTDAVNATEKALREAGCERDESETTGWFFGWGRQQREYEERDHDQHRFSSARIVDENEDLEDSYDKEDDDDRERDEQPAWRWW